MQRLVTTIFPKLKTHCLKTLKGKLFKLELKRAGEEESQHACEWFELVFQVKLLLSQNSKVYFQVRANCIFFNCLADLKDFIRYCFWSRTWKSDSELWVISWDWHENTKNTEFIHSPSWAHVTFHHLGSKVPKFPKRKYHVNGHSCLSSHIQVQQDENHSTVTKRITKTSLAKDQNQNPGLPEPEPWPSKASVISLR